MRKLLLSLLLASAASAPALAQRPSNSEERVAAIRERVERHRQSEEREEPRERSERPRESAPRAVFTGGSHSDGGERAPDQVRVDRPRGEGPAERPEVVGGPNVNERGRPTLPNADTVRDSVAQWRERERGTQTSGDSPAGWRERSPGNPREQVIDRWAGRERDRVRPPVGARPDRPAPPREGATAHRRHPEWRTDWRRDHRYDWRRWRDRDRSRFRVGFYFDPFGWDYHRFGIGWRMWPSYYSDDYWLHDPWSYRLPVAPWPYRWVRYYDDAILVNTITGQVEDVIYEFFW